MKTLKEILYETEAEKLNAPTSVKHRKIGFWKHVKRTLSIPNLEPYITELITLLYFLLTFGPFGFAVVAPILISIIYGPGFYAFIPWAFVPLTLLWSWYVLYTANPEYEKETW
jgi:hypothetical protein